MQLKNKKGFLLLDSLICVFVTCLLCSACYAIFNLITKYDEGYIKYQEESNEKLERTYNNMFECLECVIDEPD